MSSIGVISILIAIALLIFFVYKGLHVLVAAPLAAMLVAGFNGLGLVDGYSKNYMAGLAGFAQNNLPIYLWGAIMGELYNQSGAAISIAKLFSNLFRGKKEHVSVFTSIFIISLIGVIMSYGGISGIVLMFVLMPMTLGIMEECGIPREMAPGVLLGSIATAALTLPGSPQMNNTIPMQYLGTSSTAALIPGIIGGIVVLGGNIAFLTWAANSEIKKGNIFKAAVGDEDLKASIDKKELPNPILSLLPLVITFFFFNMFKLYIGYSIMLGIVAGIVLFYKQLGGSIKSLSKLIGLGAASACVLCFSSAALSGFGSVVSATETFKGISAALTAIDGPPLFISMIAICLITGICGSGPAGLGAALPMFHDTFVALGVNMNAVHRIGAFAGTTLDTLPTNAGFIAATGIAKTPADKSYKYVGVCTVLNTTIATFVVTLLLTLFPGLA